MRYLVEHPDQVLELLGQHLWLTALTLTIAFAVALPLSVLAVRFRALRGPLLGILGILYTIPSLAFFVLLIPLMGLGLRPAITALVVYAQVILVRNITVGLVEVDQAVLEAARGMGMNPWQCFWRVELPLALPLILAGIRIATLTTIGIGTIAAFINAGGLGTLLFIGVLQSNPDKIIAGAIAVSALALAANWLTRALEGRVVRATRGAA